MRACVHASVCESVSVSARARRCLYVCMLLGGVRTYTYVSPYIYVRQSVSVHIRMCTPVYAHIHMDVCRRMRTSVRVRVNVSFTSRALTLSRAARGEERGRRPRPWRTPPGGAGDEG